MNRAIVSADWSYREFCCNLNSIFFMGQVYGENEEVVELVFSTLG
jgi:hypothetical protein